MEPGAELPFARLSFSFLRPVPLAPLTLTTRIVRPGRRVQELEAELRAVGPEDGQKGKEEEEGGVLVCRAHALRLCTSARGVARVGAEGRGGGRGPAPAGA